MLKKVQNLFSIVSELTKKVTLPVLFIIIIGLVTHFLYLDKIPVGLTHDDADVVVSMKTLAENGVDVAGVSFPSLLFFNKTQGNISGFASFIFSPIFKVIELNLFSIHLLYVLVNIFTLGMFSLLVFKLSSKYKVALLTFAIGILNPWLFAYSRYPTEANIALLFVSIALVFFYTKNKFSLLLSSLFFVFAFYSYYGAKVSVTLLFPGLIFLSLIREGISFKAIKKFILPLLLFVVPVLFYFWMSLFSASSTLTTRLGNEFIFKDLGVYETQTNEFRKISLDVPFKNFFYNKYSFLTEIVFKKYLGWISPEVLFFEGDPVAVYKFSDHGLFYILDIFLFVLGISYFAINSKKYNDLITLSLLLLIIAPIGSSISNIGTSYFFRSFLLLPPLIILLGCGLYFLEKVLKQFNLKLIWYVFLILYALLFVRFLIFYFVRYPIYSQENNFLSERVLTSYVDRLSSSGKNVSTHVVNIESFKNLHMFYTSDLSIGNNITVTNECSPFDIGQTAIYDSVLSCTGLSDNYHVILNQKDSGAIYKIYNDTLCDKNNLTSYRRVHLLSDYNIEKMTDSEFCNRWIQNGNLNETTK